jgi:hypothetical protein
MVIDPISDGFQGVMAGGILYGIWNNILTRREAVKAAHRAEAAAIDASKNAQNAVEKIEQVHLATNSLVKIALDQTALASHAQGVSDERARTDAAGEPPPQT